MRKICLFTAGLVVLLNQSLPADSTASTPELNVAITDAVVRVDGRLDEACWHRPPDATEFQVLTSGKPASQKTEVWLARDNAWLFIAFRCHEPRVADIKRDIANRDGSVHHDDSIEVFISPGSAGETYWHFLLNAAGVQGDNRAEAGKSNIKWDGHWRSAVCVETDNNEWTAELAVPLFYLAGAAGDGEWTGNFTRTRRVETPEFNTWSPADTTFHPPKTFGVLRGLRGLKADPVFAPVLTDVKVGPLLDIPRRYYEVELGLKNQGELPGIVNVYAVDRTVEGATSTPQQQQALGAGHSAKIKIEVDVEKIVMRTTDVAGTLTDNLGVWTWNITVDRQRESKPLITAMEQSWYADDPVGRLVYQVNLPPSIISDCFVRAAVGDEGEFGPPVRLAGAAGRVDIPIGNLETGVYRVRAELLDADNVVLAASECKLTKFLRAPDAGSRVMLDRWNRCLRVDGKPVFPFGFVSPSAASMLKAMDTTAVIRWSSLDVAKTIEFMDESQRLGLMVIDVPTFNLPSHKISIVKPEWPEAFHKDVEELIPEYIDALKFHPALMGWYGIDEPGWEVHKQGCRLLTDTINEQDGFHPNIQLFAGLPANDEEWLSFADINTVDIYALDPMTVLTALRAYAAMADYLQQPNWVMLLGETCSGSTTILPPANQRCQTYLTLITGASGIFYFIMPVTHADTFAVFKQLAADIRIMEPALLTRAPEQIVTVSSESAGRDRLPLALRIFPDGAGLLLAANPLPDPVEVDIASSAFDMSVKVSGLSGDRLGASKDGIISDKIEAFGVRAWRIDGLKMPEAGRPVTINLTIKDQPAPSHPAETQADCQKNLLVDGGFETGDGWRGVTNGVKLDTNMPHSGRVALRFDRAQNDPTKAVISRRFMLKPNTKYKYSGWARVEAESARHGLTFSVYSLAKNKSLVYRGVSLRPEWTAWSGTFETDAEAQEVECYIYAAKDSFTGTGWADDLVLEELPVVKSRNILPNSGFEYDTVRLRPDRWNFLPFLPFKQENLTGNTRPFITLDDKDVYQGKYSLRLVGIQQIFTQPSRNPFEMEWGEDYVFSIYMKADRDDVICWMRINNNSWTQAVVGREWKRFYTIGKAPATRTPFLHIGLRTEGAGGMPLNKAGWWTGDLTKLSFENAATVWMDAAQLEKGTEPTEYVPDVWRP